MTITEALKKSDYVRRKGLEKHVGSGGDGWVSIQILLYRPSYSITGSDNNLHLSKDDLLADDWEARPECECCRRPYKVDA